MSDSERFMAMLAAILVAYVAVAFAFDYAMRFSGLPIEHPCHCECPPDSDS